MIEIRSRQNPKIRDLRQTARKAGKSDFVVVEGEKIIAEARAAGLRMESLWSDQQAHQILADDCPAFRISNQLLAWVSPFKSPQSPVAVFRQPAMHGLESWPAGAGPWVLLDGIQDPGNAGALIRAASAFGFRGVIWRSGSVSPFHPATVRASAGAVFHLPHSQIRQLPTNDAPYPLIAADGGGDLLIHDLVWPKTFILILGNEGHGISHEILARAQITIRIPYPGPVESLNVTGAAHILMFKYHEQTIPWSASPT